MATELVKKSSEVNAPERTRQGAIFTPRIDIVETQEELILYADMPGVEPDNLDIRYENRELTILGKITPRHQGVRYLYWEYGVGDFYRSFTIGETIDAEKIHAELKNGVLVVHLPKTEAVKPRRIQVKAN